MRISLCKTTLIFAVLASLSACSMYSPTRDKQAHDLRAAYSRVDLKAQVEVPRDRRKKILEEQIKTVEDLSSLQTRNAVLSVVTADNEAGTVTLQLNNIAVLFRANDYILPAVHLDIIKKAKFEEESNRKAVKNDSLEITKIAGDFRNTRLGFYEEWKKNIAEAIKLEKGARDATLTQFRSISTPVPSCDSVDKRDKSYRALEERAKKPTAAADMVLASTLPTLELMCKTAIEKRKNYKAEKTPNVIIILQQELAKQKDEYTALENQYNDDKEEIEKQMASINVDSTGCKSSVDCLAKLKTKAAALGEKIMDVEKKGNALSVKFLSDAKQESLDKFLSVIAAYDPDKPFTDEELKKLNDGASKTGLALVFYLGLQDEIQKQSDASERSVWSGLVMHKNAALAQSEAAKKELSVREQRMTILEEQIALRWMQFDRVGKADQLANKEIGNIGAQPVLSLFDKSNKPPVDNRVNALRALAYYMDAGGRLEKEFAKKELNLRALDREITLGTTEANINQWAILLEGNIASLEAAGASGVKDELINKAVDSIILLWIGMGVH